MSSTSSFFLQPDKSVLINSVSQIKSQSENWPFWNSRPWIVAGQLESDDVVTKYEGPFINDCKGELLNIQVNTLLQVFDWAIFSYFTTYQSSIYSVVTKNESLVVALTKKHNKKGFLEKYSAESDILSELKYSTFYDYDKEGELAYQIAMERGEEPPYLLCSVNLDDPDLYRYWDEEREKHQDFIWYEEYTKQLALVDVFQVQDEYKQRLEYTIYRVTDVEAYSLIWAMASDECSITDATFSADTDLQVLRNHITNKKYLDLMYFPKFIGTWAYNQVYGGGSDEHHAIFYSKDSAVTQMIWELSGDNQISRF